DWPKCPKVAGFASGAVQCGDLSLRISYPSPQSLWVCLPNPGSTPGRPGNCTVRALSAKSAEIRVGVSSSRPRASTSRVEPLAEWAGLPVIEVVVNSRGSITTARAQPAKEV